MNLRIRGPTLLLVLRSSRYGSTTSVVNGLTVAQPLPSSFPSSPPSASTMFTSRRTSVSLPIRFRGGGGGSTGGCSSSSSSCSSSSSLSATTAPQTTPSTTPPPPPPAVAAATAEEDGINLEQEEQDIKRVTLRSLSLAPPVSHFANLPYVNTAASKSRNPHRVLFILGGPGAGKGTQCEQLVSTYHCVHLSAGELLREERALADGTGGNPTADLIEDCLVNGKIVPVAITLGLLRKAMDRVLAEMEAEAEVDAGEGQGDEQRKYGAPLFLVDGFPRNYDNLEGWIADFCPSSSAETPSDAQDPSVLVLGALVYDCPIQILEQRILSRAETSGRSDDNLESARRRFQTFRRETVPVVRVLELVEKDTETGGMHVEHIRGDKTIPEVWEETQRTMDNFVRHDVLTANAELLTAVEEVDVDRYTELCSDGFLTDCLPPSEDAAESTKKEEGLLESIPDKKRNRAFHKYETVPSKDGLRCTVRNATVKVHDGTEATVTYDRQMVDGEGNTLAEFCETRVWSHRSKGWICVHFARTPVF